MPLTGNNNLIYLISSTVTSNTACSQKCVKISAVFKNRLNDCNVLKSAELASSAFHTLTTRLQKKYYLVLRKLIHVHLKQDWPGPRHDLILPPPPCDPTSWVRPQRVPSEVYRSVSRLKMHENRFRLHELPHGFNSTLLEPWLAFKNVASRWEERPKGSGW